MSVGQHGASRIATNGAGTPHEADHEEIWEEEMKRPPVVVVELEITGPPITEANFAAIAGNFLLMLCQPGHPLGVQS